MTTPDGQFAWQPSPQMGAPDRFDSQPVYSSEFMPGALTAGEYIGLLADFSYYKIFETPNVAVQRLIEVGYQENNVIYVGRKYMTAGPVLEEAFVRIKVGV